MQKKEIKQAIGMCLLKIKERRIASEDMSKNCSDSISLSEDMNVTQFELGQLKKV